MSTSIVNTAQITYNGKTLPPTCPVITRIEPNISIHKYAITDKGRFASAGTMGEARKATYEILIENHSSRDFTNVVIEDNVVLPDGYTASSMSYVVAESMLPNTGTLPNIKLAVGTLPKNSSKIVYYTIQYASSIPKGKIINNQASVNYTENPIKDESGKTVPYKSENIALTISYTTTNVQATKTGPEVAYCGEVFDYVLVFQNTGENVAANVSITDTLPANFVVSSVAILNGTKNLVRNQDFVYSEQDRPLVITSKGTGLDIAAGTQMTVTIKGKFVCTS